jgi:hypothetical protein
MVLMRVTISCEYFPKGLISVLHRHRIPVHTVASETDCRISSFGAPVKKKENESCARPTSKVQDDNVNISSLVTRALCAPNYRGPWLVRKSELVRKIQFHVLERCVTRCHLSQPKVYICI